MIQHVHERASRARTVDRVLVATDDERIAEAVRGFGGSAVMTSSAHATGTDRLAEAALQAADADVVVNVQGDEPMLDPAGIDAAVAPLLAEPAVVMSTLSLPITDYAEMASPSVVKVVSDGRGDALYFSRSAIPHVRLEPPDDGRAPAREAVRRGLARKHVGLYVYRRETLARLASLPRSPLEEAEGLEQLRALHHGIRIRVVPFAGDAGVAVDTPADLLRVREFMKERA
jgi:3-deoxy-manno-octulosonate cytidylyltransferase (CMP-KDO synthetase)